MRVKPLPQCLPQWVIDAVTTVSKAQNPCRHRLVSSVVRRLLSNTFREEGIAHSVEHTHGAGLEGRKDFAGSLPPTVGPAEPLRTQLEHALTSLSPSLLSSCPGAAEQAASGTCCRQPRVLAADSSHASELSPTHTFSLHVPHNGPCHWPSGRFSLSRCNMYDAALEVKLGAPVRKAGA